jgi:hypothetical protein
MDWPVTATVFRTLLADLHRGSDPRLLNITTCDVTRGAVVEISEESRLFGNRSHTEAVAGRLIGLRDEIETNA